MYGSSGNSRRLSAVLDPITDLSNDNFSKADIDEDEDNSDNKSTSASESGQSSGDFGGKRRESAVVPEIAGRENRLVLCGKLLVFAVLACGAAGVGILTFFFFVSSEEENDYAAQACTSKTTEFSV
jgi:hypothetical protein